ARRPLRRPHAAPDRRLRGEHACHRFDLRRTDDRAPRRGDAKAPPPRRLGQGRARPPLRHRRQARAAAVARSWAGGEAPRLRRRHRRAALKLIRPHLLLAGASLALLSVASAPSAEPTASALADVTREALKSRDTEVRYAALQSLASVARGSATTR